MLYWVRKRTEHFGDYTNMKHRVRRHLSIALSILLLGGLFFVVPSATARAEVQVSSWQQLYEAIDAQPENSTETYLLAPGLVAADLPLPEADPNANPGDEGDEADPGTAGEGEEDAGGEPDAGSEPDTEGEAAGEADDAQGRAGTIIIYNRTVILSGGAIARGEGFTAALFDVRGGGRLTLTGGLSMEGLAHHEGEGLINVFGQNAVCVLEDATLANNHTAPGYATLTVDAGGALEIQDGQITGNLGGGVVQAAGATASVRMSGGAIHQNTCSSGAVVNLYSNASFILSGGDIEKNIAPNGGVYNDGIFSMLAGNISANTATADGGGVYNNATFALAGGSITSNTAEGKGGGVYNAVSGSVYLAGGRVGLSATDNAIFNMASAASLVITQNLRSTSFYNVGATGGLPPQPGDALAVKERSDSLGALTDDEARLFAVWDGTLAQLGAAEGDSVVLGGGAPAVPDSQPTQTIIPTDAAPPDITLWVVLAAVALAGAVGVCVVYFRISAKNKKSAKKTDPK
uniref:Uncharacterized protein n=1 Tax=termite gut metagenome TaxID=433724 RepID=S0DFF4_9ZZZZ